MIGYVQNLHFTNEDIDYLRSLQKFSEPFLDYLRHFIFTGEIYAVPEGTPVFPYEPLLRVKAKIIEAQLLETALLLALNHQTLIATKASRIVRSAKGRAVMGLGQDVHIISMRPTMEHGQLISAESSVLPLLSQGKNLGSVLGTMAHSFIQSYESEYEAFRAYALTYPDSCTVLLDTYDTLKSGLPNAIKVAKEVLEPMGKRMAGVRIDSGDIAYLSKKIRKELDRAGMQDCKIVASNSFDEYIIKSLIEQGRRSILSESVKT